AIFFADFPLILHTVAFVRTLFDSAGKFSNFSTNSTIQDLLTRPRGGGGKRSIGGGGSERRHFRAPTFQGISGADILNRAPTF
ncbi:MAG: hypothetical protein ACK559_14740, partial [bacterium]